MRQSSCLTLEFDVETLSFLLPTRRGLYKDQPCEQPEDCWSTDVEQSEMKFMCCHIIQNLRVHLPTPPVPTPCTIKRTPNSPHPPPDPQDKKIKLGLSPLLH